MTAVGGFNPRGPTHDVGGLLDPKDAFKSLFLRGKVPMRGSIGVLLKRVSSILSSRTPPVMMGAATWVARRVQGWYDNNALYDKNLHPVLLPPAVSN